MEQGLPISFDNTAATWQQMPMYAAMQTGQQNRIAQENIAALQKAFEAEQAFKAQERPVQLQNLMKSGILTEAQARHADALSRASGLSSDRAAATMSGEIASTNAKNQGEVVASEQAQHAMRTTRYAAWLEAGGNKMPPFMQAQKFMETFGVDQRHGQEVLQNIPKLVQMIPQEARKLYQLSPAGQGVMIKEEGDTSRNNATIAANKSIAAGNNATQLQIAKNKLKDRSLEFETQFRKVNSLEKLVLLNQEAQIMDSIGETKKAEEYRQRAQDPVLYKAAQAIASQGGTSTIRRNPDGTIEVIPRQEAVNLSGENKPRVGTPENPIKLD
jgi:hypothetical protein